MTCALTPDLVSLRFIERAVATIDLESYLSPEATKARIQSIQGHIWGLIRTMAIETATKVETRTTSANATATETRYI